MCRLQPLQPQFYLGRVSGQSGTRPHGPTVRINSVALLVEYGRGTNLTDEDGSAKKL